MRKLLELEEKKAQVHIDAYLHSLCHLIDSIFVMSFAISRFSFFQKLSLEKEQVSAALIIQKQIRSKAARQEFERKRQVNIKPTSLDLKTTVALPMATNFGL